MRGPLKGFSLRRCVGRGAGLGIVLAPHEVMRDLSLAEVVRLVVRGIAVHRWEGLKHERVTHILLHAPRDVAPHLAIHGGEEVSGGCLVLEEDHP